MDECLSVQELLYECMCVSVQGVLCVKAYACVLACMWGVHVSVCKCVCYG